MKQERRRIDTLLVEKGLASSREKAQALILAGAVLVNNTPIEKAGTKVSQSAEIRLRGAVSPYVGRGGEKLASALDLLKVQVEGVIAIDLGASTGGFTDCLLQRGAVKVYAVDVGDNQLAYRLRTDSRVVVMERTHARDLTRELFGEPIHFATVDVSFIGLRKVLPYLFSVLTPPYRILALVKPQFELGPEYVKKGGVVSDPSHQRHAVKQVEEFVKQAGLLVVSSAPASIRGAKKGNQEYFVLITTPAENSNHTKPLVKGRLTSGEKVLKFHDVNDDKDNKGML